MAWQRELSRSCSPIATPANHWLTKLLYQSTTAAEHRKHLIRARAFANADGAHSARPRLACARRPERWRVCKRPHTQVKLCPLRGGSWRWRRYKGDARAARLPRETWSTPYGSVYWVSRAAVQSERKPNQITSRVAPHEMYVVNNCVRGQRRRGGGALDRCVCVCVCSCTCEWRVGEVWCGDGEFMCGNAPADRPHSSVRARAEQVYWVYAVRFGCLRRVATNFYICMRSENYKQSSKCWQKLTQVIVSQNSCVCLYGQKYDIFSCWQLLIRRLWCLTHSCRWTSCVSADQIDRQPYSQTSHTITYESDIKSGLTCLMSTCVWCCVLCLRDIGSQF